MGNTIEEKLYDVLVSIDENLGSLIAAQVRSLDNTKEERETTRLLTVLATKFDGMCVTLASFTQQQQSFELRQRDLENKVTRILAYGGAGLTVVELLIHFLGGK